MSFSYTCRSCGRLTVVIYWLTIPLGALVGTGETSEIFTWVQMYPLVTFSFNSRI